MFMDINHMKSIIQSKVVWLNTITLILGILALPEFTQVLPTIALPYILLTNAILNLILRMFFTNQPITQFAKGK